MNPRLQSLQALRGIAVLLVVGFHLRRLTGLETAGSYLPEWTVHLQSGVDLFFVISGYVMVYVVQRPDQPPPPTREFLLKRAMRILPLYWLLTLLAASLHFAAPALVPPRSEALSSSLLGSLFLWPQASAPLIGQGWSLVHEAYFYVMFAVIFTVCGRHLARGLIGWSALVFAGLLYFGPFDNDSSPGLRTVFHPLSFEFAAGAALALLHQAGHRRVPRLSLVVGLALWLFSLPQMEFPQHGSLRALWDGSAAVLIVHGCVALEQNDRWSPPAALVAIGNASYSIYLSHLAVLVLLATGWVAWMGPSAPTSVWLLRGLFFITSILVGFVFWRYVETPLQATCTRIFLRNHRSTGSVADR